MPIYEYECRSCGKRFDRMQSFHDEPVRVCPECGGETRRVFQPVGVIFKGSGWYVNDSRKPPAESKPASSGTPAGGAKTESTASPPETGAAAKKSDSPPPAPAKTSDGGS